MENQLIRIKHTNKYYDVNIEYGNLVAIKNGKETPFLHLTPNEQAIFDSELEVFLTEGAETIDKDYKFAYRPVLNDVELRFKVDKIKVNNQIYKGIIGINK